MTASGADNDGARGHHHLPPPPLASQRQHQSSAAAGDPPRSPRSADHPRYSPRSAVLDTNVLPPGYNLSLALGLAPGPGPEQGDADSDGVGGLGRSHGAMDDCEFTDPLLRSSSAGGALRSAAHEGRDDDGEAGEPMQADQELPHGCASSDDSPLRTLLPHADAARRADERGSTTAPARHPAPRPPQLAREDPPTAERQDGASGAPGNESRASRPAAALYTSQAEAGFAAIRRNPSRAAKHPRLDPRAGTAAAAGGSAARDEPHSAPASRAAIAGASGADATAAGAAVQASRPRAASVPRQSTSASAGAHAAEERKEKRRQQNRNAQRNHKAKREAKLQQMEADIAQARSQMESVTAENEALLRLAKRLQAENDALRSARQMHGLDDEQEESVAPATPLLFADSARREPAHASSGRESTLAERHSSADHAPPHAFASASTPTLLGASDAGPRQTSRNALVPLHRPLLPPPTWGSPSLPPPLTHGRVPLLDRAASSASLTLAPIASPSSGDPRRALLAPFSVVADGGGVSDASDAWHADDRVFSRGTIDRGDGYLPTPPLLARSSLSAGPVPLHQHGKRHDLPSDPPLRSSTDTTGTG